MHPAVNKLVAPGQRRQGIWRNGVLQIHITRACNRACVHCTQGSNLAGKPAMMTVAEFERACQSLDQYWGVVGLFGGNPALHRDFEEICKIMKGYFPLEQRGIWCNDPVGKGAIMRSTFWPAHSNINVHLDSDAAAEFRRDWPEVSPYIKGETQDSLHGAPFVAIKDVVVDEEQRWAMIADCDVSRWWSACIGVVPGRGLRGYFCELAYAQAALHAVTPDAADWPDTGLEVKPGWWRQPMSAFEAQVNLHCHSCGIPLRRPGVQAIGGTREEFSETHRAIARPKTRGREVSFVGVESLERSERPSTQYLPGVTPGYRGQ